MNRQLTVVVALLSAALLLHFATRERADGPIEDPAALFAKLLPKPVVMTDVQAISVHKGREADSGLEFRRSGEIWIAPQRFDAAVLKAKVERIAEEVNAMEGEMRSDSADLLGQYMLGEREGIHFVFYGQGSAEIEHVIVGKRGSDYRSSFARRAAETKAYYVANNPLSSVNVYTDAVEASLSIDPFLDKTALSMSEDLAKIEIRATGEVIVAEYLTETTAEAEARRVGTAPVELRKYWAITSPKGFEYESSKIEAYARAVRSVTARDLEDPAKAAARDHGTVSVTLVAVNGRERKLLFAAREGSDFPLKVEGGGKDFYLLADYEYNKAVKALSDFAKEKPATAPVPEPAPVVVPEPAPAVAPEPAPAVVPAPAPVVVPEPAPAPVAQPEPAPAPEPEKDGPQRN